MKKLTAIAIAPLCAGFLFAQSEQSAQRETRTETTTTTQSTWNGTLVDASCRTTQTAHRESTETSKVDENTTRTTRTTSDSSRAECPVTTSTTAFGIMTSDGKFIAFDDPSNSKVVQVVKSNRDWSRNMSEHKPVSVRVVGNQKGDTIVVESIK